MSWKIDNDGYMYEDYEDDLDEPEKEDREDFIKQK